MRHEEKIAKLVKIMYDHLALTLEDEQWAGMELTEITAWLCAMSFNVQPNSALKRKQVKYVIKMLQEISTGGQ